MLSTADVASPSQALPQDFLMLLFHLTNVVVPFKTIKPLQGQQGRRLMRIGQLAQLVGVETQTIRFYEQQGLLPPPDRQNNGYRVYTEKHSERLAFIRRCRILDLSLAEIHELQSYQDEPHQPCTAVNALLDDHISQVRSQITGLQALEKQLVSLRASCNDDREIEVCGVLAGISEGSVHQQEVGALTR